MGESKNLKEEFTNVVAVVAHPVVVAGTWTEPRYGGATGGGGRQRVVMKATPEG